MAGQSPDGDILAGLERRPARPEDEAFLRALYAESRQQELAVTGWTDAQKATFLSQQFAAQQAHYHQVYAGAEFSVLRRDGRDIGRLYVARWPREIRVIDILLAAEWRGRGLGGALMRELQAEAARTGRTLSIHVERNNPAIRLYERLGFSKQSEYGVYHLMAWQANAGDQVKMAS